MERVISCAARNADAVRRVIVNRIVARLRDNRGVGGVISVAVGAVGERNNRICNRDAGCAAGADFQIERFADNIFERDRTATNIQNGIRAADNRTGNAAAGNVERIVRAEAVDNVRAVAVCVKNHVAVAVAGNGIVAGTAVERGFLNVSGGNAVIASFAVQHQTFVRSAISNGIVTGARVDSDAVGIRRSRRRTVVADNHSVRHTFFYRRIGGGSKIYI